MKSSSIKNHTLREKHRANAGRRDKSQRTILSFGELVRDNEGEHSAAGATLPLNVMSCRMSVVHAFLKTGTPFSLLENGSEIHHLIGDEHACCPKQAYNGLIPVLRKREHENWQSQQHFP